MGEYTSETGSKTSSVVTAGSPGRINEYTKVTSKTTASKATGFIRIKTKASIWGHGKTINSMDLVSTNQQMANKITVVGARANLQM